MIFAGSRPGGSVRQAGADELADRLDQALDDDVKLLALTIDERAIILAALEDPPDGLAELRAVLLRRRSLTNLRSCGTSSFTSLPRV